MAEYVLTNPKLMVWTLEECEPYEGCGLLGVFSTEALANEHSEKYKAERRFVGDLNVTGWVVNDPEAEVA